MNTKKELRVVPVIASFIKILNAEKTKHAKSMVKAHALQKHEILIAQDLLRASGPISARRTPAIFHIGYAPKKTENILYAMHTTAKNPLAMRIRAGVITIPAPKSA